PVSPRLILNISHHTQLGGRRFVATGQMAEEFNRVARFECYEHFVTQSNRKDDYWFFAEYLKSLGDEIRTAGGRSLEVPADVGDRTRVAAAFQSIRADLGAPEVLIYNAGSGPFGSLSEISADDF